MGRIDEKEDGYFNYLCDLIKINSGFHSYYNLMNILFKLDYFYKSVLDDNREVLYDENRQADGLKLRQLYYSEYGVKPITKCFCSVLEVLIALSLKICEDIFYNDGNVYDIFMDMLENLNIRQFDDSNYFNNSTGRTNAYYINERIHTFLTRTYNYDGTGGNIFIIKNKKMLKDNKIDLRDCDLWYQVSLYY